ncbi:DUF1549 domain-containing protein [Flexithrix dorotheae]|uniref:DUF1549 domain-containing protein n=1 Tax=Flexithrix dorotheae TaxID=70993 RepID=UPI00037B6E6D|nr:DUF1549 domain-containing protein [Flexithrix dorotheae]
MNENEWNWIFQFLGRLHPLAVHFPIGLLVVALFLEVLTLKGKRPGLREGINWMIYLGATFSVLATGLGWLLRTFEDYAGDLVQLHQNLGILTAILAVVTALILQKTLIGKLSNYILYRSFLLLSVVSLTITGHLGASLTHGEDFLSGVLPNNSESYDDNESIILLAKLNKLDSLSEPQLDDLNLGVRAIFAHNCYQCHSENKQKGELVLDNKRGVFQGGESGKVIIPGNPNASELYKRITLPPDDDHVMPKKGKVLKDNEIALVKLWIEKGAHWSDRQLKIFPEAELALTKPELPASSVEKHPVDKLVDVYFEQNDIDWEDVVDDKTFIRRAYLDIVGLLPEPEAISQFEQNQNIDKRSQLIDNLLNDKHNYTQHWLSFWNDLLRNDYSGTGFITGGRKQITNWLYNALLENKPYDSLISQLINPTPESEGFIKGIQWRGLVNASQRTEMQAAQNIGQSLMGVNVKCASCHNSFVSNLTLDQAYGFASIFADSVLELNRCDKPIGKMATVNFLYPELGAVEADSLKERLLKLSEVMVKPENGRLYRTITNRIWERLMGRGIIEPLDEMDNIPWDADLLDWLAADFIASGHDLKHLIKTIMTSKVYQLPSIDYKKPEQIKSPKYVFEGPVVRRMSAEQFADAVSQVISPVYYAAAYDPTGEGFSTRRIWHRERKFDRDVLPDPGKRYFRHKFTLTKKEILEAKALISVDHAYTFYLNGQKVSAGSDWRKVDKLEVTNFLNTGENIIAIEGENEGSIANPAGILFVMKILQQDSIETIIQSAHADEDWKSTDESPEGDWLSLDFDDEEWDFVLNYGSKHWDKLLNFNFDDQGSSYARASLVRQHPFMKALGRPSRENVTTSRDEQATLLQALELTNGAFFNKILEEGAVKWLKENNYQGKMIVDSLYLKSFGRQPTKKEKTIMLSSLGEQPDQEGLQDLFWATMLSPEFQFIY